MDSASSEALAALDLRGRSRHGAPNRKIVEGRTSRWLRKKIEMLFAHLKRILELYVYEAQMARVTSSSSQPLPRTFGR